MSVNLDNVRLKRVRKLSRDLIEGLRELYVRTGYSLLNHLADNPLILSSSIVKIK